MTLLQQDNPHTKLVVVTAVLVVVFILSLSVGLLWVDEQFTVWLKGSSSGCT